VSTLPDYQHLIDDHESNRSRSIACETGGCFTTSVCHLTTTTTTTSIGAAHTVYSGPVLLTHWAATHVWTQKVHDCGVIHIITVAVHPPHTLTPHGRTARRSGTTHARILSPRTCIRPVGVASVRRFTHLTSSLAVCVCVCVGGKRRKISLLLRISR